MQFRAGLLLLPLLLCSCGKDAPKTAEAAENAARAEESVPVECIHATLGPICRTLATTSTIEATQRADVFLRAGGIVQSIACEEGDHVTAGQVLALLQDKEPALAEEKARLQADKLKGDLARKERMLKDKLISQETCEETRFQYNQAELEWRQAKLSLDNTRILSPIAGTVTARTLRLGELAGLNQKVFTVVDLSILECAAFIPEKQITTVRADQKARILSDAYPDRTFDAAIARISPVIDNTSGTAKVTLHVANPEGILRPGMFVKVGIILDTRPQATLLPKKAVLYQDNVPGVYVVRSADPQGSGAAKWAPLEIGYTDPERLEITAGIGTEDAVVIVGQHGLKDGTKVHIMKGDK